MEEEKNENQNSDNTGVESGEPESATDSNESALAEKNKQLFARAKRAEEESKALREELEKLKNVLSSLSSSEKKKEEESGEKHVPDLSSLESKIEEKVSLRLEGYSPQEISYIEAFASQRGVSLTEAAKDPFVVSGIEGLRQREKVNQATPTPSTKPAEKGEKKSPAQMTTKEKASLLEEMLEKRKGSRQFV